MVPVGVLDVCVLSRATIVDDRDLVIGEDGGDGSQGEKDGFSVEHCCDVRCDFSRLVDEWMLMKLCVEE